MGECLDCIVCQVCGYQAQGIEDLKSHYIKAHSEECSICEAFVEYEEDMIQHWRDFHVKDLSINSRKC